MDFINLLATTASWPQGGFWQTIIGWFGSFIANYGWTIVVFTICLKLVLLPLDVFQKVITRKNAEKQAILQPEMQKLQKRYGANKNLLNQKTMELYKKNNYNVVTSCLGMLVNLVLTLVIFITLFSALNSISQFKIKDEFAQLDLEYRTVYSATFDGTNVEESKLAAQSAVSTKYGQIKEGWLWVKNIWRPDTWVSVFPDYEEYVKISATTYTTNIVGEEYIYKDLNNVTYTTEESAKQAAKADYETITTQIAVDYSGWNGLLLLVVMAGAITYLSQKLMNQGFSKKKKQAQKPEDQQMANPLGNQKYLGFLLMGLMIIFTIMYSTAFAIYIVTNSIMSVLISLCINTVIDAVNSKKEQKKAQNTGRAQISQKGNK